MPVTTTADGKRIYHVSKTGGVTGADRAGAKASDIIAAMTDPKEGSRQEPQVEKAARLIESMRIEGADNLTARDQAVYEYLLAQARAGHRAYRMAQDGHEGPVHIFKHMGREGLQLRVQRNTAASGEDAIGRRCRPESLAAVGPANTPIDCPSPGCYLCSQ